LNARTTDNGKMPQWIIMWMIIMPFLVKNARKNEL